MPLYTFENIKTGKIEDAYFGMLEKKEYAGENGDELGQWRRIWLKPNASQNTKIDPFDPKSFVAATNKPGKIGDLWDLSAEMSAKRAEKNGGIDEIREKSFDDYAAKRGGTEHPTRKRERILKKLKSQGIELTPNK